jgi:hypothetical protein
MRFAVPSRAFRPKDRATDTVWPALIGIGAGRGADRGSLLLVRAGRASMATADIQAAMEQVLVLRYGRQLRAQITYHQSS